MKNIAITGSFASGKSSLLKLLKAKGKKVFSCDEYVQKLYEDLNIKKLVEKSIDKLSLFDKKDLAEIIYNNKQERKKLESIIHPKVLEGIKQFEQENVGEKIIFTEIPLLFEAGFDKYFAYSICVFCSEKTRRERAESRGVRDAQLFAKITGLQLTQEEKKNRSDFVIDTEKDAIEINQLLDKIIEKIK